MVLKSTNESRMHYRPGDHIAQKKDEEVVIISGKLIILYCYKPSYLAGHTI